MDDGMIYMKEGIVRMVGAWKEGRKEGRYREGGGQTDG